MGHSPRTTLVYPYRSVHARCLAAFGSEVARQLTLLQPDL